MSFWEVKFESPCIHSFVSLISICIWCLMFYYIFPYWFVYSIVLKSGQARQVELRPDRPRAGVGPGLKKQRKSEHGVTQPTRGWSRAGFKKTKKVKTQSDPARLGQKLGCNLLNFISLLKRRCFDFFKKMKLTLTTRSKLRIQTLGRVNHRAGFKNSNL